MSVDFAVWHEGLPEGSGRWVLGRRDEAEASWFLLANEDKSFYWKPINECTLVMAHTPEQPTMVVAMQPPQQNGLVMPEPNRQMRRNGGY